MINTQASSPTPWYRQGWPWFIISFPLIAVVAGITTWYIAWRSNDGLVADDYYKQGLEINRSLDSQNMARMLGLKGELSAEGDLLRLRMVAEREISFPETLQLAFFSPTRAGHDLMVELHRNGDVYEAKMASLDAGHWNLALTDIAGTWKIPAAGVFPLKGNLSIKP